jgi:hypothetical protein
VFNACCLFVEIGGNPVPEPAKMIIPDIAWCHASR